MRCAGEPPTLAALRRHIDARLDRIPRFRRRLGALPGGLAWVDDAGFDVAPHVHRLELAAPGGIAELRDTAALLLGQPLDMERPLWRVYLVDGLQDGFAVVGQAHHALIDGIAAVEVAMLLFDDGGEHPASTWRSVRAPSAGQATRDAAQARVTGSVRALG